MEQRLAAREADGDRAVDGARLWSTKGLPAIGTKRVKASEMGQLVSRAREGIASLDTALGVEDAGAA